MSENENYTPEEMNKALFSHLVMSLASSAMQHLGKLVNPASGKTEVNIDAAQSTIDVVEMLAAKTKGNLDSEESRFLAQTLTALRMNYVETASGPAAKPEEKKDAQPAEKASETPPPPADESAENKKRFSKKYE
jgi:hypothetical protein